LQHSVFKRIVTAIVHCILPYMQGSAD